MKLFTAVVAALILVLAVGHASAEPRVWVGMEKKFTKPADSDWTSATYQDRITDKVVVTRGDKKGIFNIAQEPGYKPSPPAGTEWAYGTASNWQNLRFESWETWNSRIPPNMVNQDAVLHLIDEDVYLDIKFTAWTESAAGGGFSYTRATEGVSGEKVWTGTSIVFTKADYADWTQAANQDRITDDVWITRRDREGIFNIAQEREYRLNPPSGTTWAFGTASNWASLTFQPLDKLHNKSPESMVDRDAVMHLIDADVYVDVKFLSWTSYAYGAAFSYERSTEGTSGEKVWTGGRITFTRENWADWTTEEAQDRITDDVWITRGRWDGIFNIRNEPAFQPYPPAGTEWAFGSADDWESLTFISWEALCAVYGRNGRKEPPSLIGRAVVMHIIEEDIYLDVRFDSWSEDDTGGGFSWTRAENDPLTIVDGPLALPSLVSVDDGYVSFRMIATDEDNEPIHCDWVFGDGATGSGLNTSHTYTTAGTYTVTVTISDGTDTYVRTTGVHVNTPPRILTGPTTSHRYCEVGETVDFGATVTDEDGDPTTSEWDFGDDAEETGNTASHAWTVPGDYTVEFEVTDGMHAATATVDVTVAKPLNVVKLTGGVNYKKESKDKLKLKATLDLPADFGPLGKALILLVGGVETDFLLDAKGKGKSVAGSVKLKYSKKAGTWVLVAKLKKGEFAALWADHGVVNETVKDVAISFPARVRVGDSTFITDAPALYKGKEGKSGKFKTPK